MQPETRGPSRKNWSRSRRHRHVRPADWPVKIWRSESEQRTPDAIGSVQQSWLIGDYIRELDDNPSEGPASLKKLNIATDRQSINDIWNKSAGLRGEEGRGVAIDRSCWLRGDCASVMFDGWVSTDCPCVCVVCVSVCVVRHGATDRHDTDSYHQAVLAQTIVLTTVSYLLWMQTVFGGNYNIIFYIKIKYLNLFYL